MNQPTKAEQFKNALDSQGHSFQYAVVEEFRCTQGSKWLFEACEFPVVCKSKPIHVDVLFGQRSNYGLHAYLVCECKRTDPAYGNWIFAKAPYVHRNHFEKRLVFDFIRPATKDSVTASEPLKAHSHTAEVCHIGLAVATNCKGDGRGESRKDLNDATAQVLRATSGVIDYLYGQNRLINCVVNSVFVPAMITTAKLFVSDLEIERSTDLLSGKLTSTGTVKEVDWLWYVHNRSSELCHNQHHGFCTSFEEAMELNHSRAIAVISASGIKKFAEMNFLEAYC